jgi:DNA primase
LHDEEFRRAIEAIKLRAPIEDVVRERVPGLKKSGNGWVACCPFHEERTPSFRVDPRRGTWHCFGACGTGGDQIGFLQRIDNLPFLEALEILAARTGVELPPRSSRPGGPAGDLREKEAEEALRAVLERAVRFYRSQVSTPEGARAAAYLRERGLSEETAAAFDIGYAPASGQALVAAVRTAGVDLALARSAGLVRTSDQGRPYDFFRGRVVIPIRDERGRTVGFGARRLQDEDASAPKYINTAETALFRKGRLVYALDRALAQVRREGRIVLVEGYTDVMAAHQHGFGNVVAVLGTATTEDHAALIRRSGARRATLVFDGDEAGSKAAGKALHGLLPLDIEIDVVALRGGVDPCDLLVREGAAAFRAQLDLARGWFDHATEGLSGLSGGALSREVDRVLEFVARVRTPVHRESLLKDLAARLAIPVESLREQWRVRPDLREIGASRTATGVPPSHIESTDPRERIAWCEIVGALLADASLVPLARATAGRCPAPDLARILAALLDLYGEEDAEIDASAVMNRLADHPARDLVVPLLEGVRSAESPRAQLEGNLRFLRVRDLEIERERLGRQLAEQERLAGGAAAAASDTRAVEISRALQENRRLAGALLPD